jgi:hypothetical protein
LSPNTTTTKKFLRQTGSGTNGAAPAWDTVVASDIASGQIALAYGGTNANLTAVNGAVAYSTASALALTAAGTSGQVLTSAGAASPTWSNQGLFSGGRLTLTSGTPVTTSDVTGATTIYYTPYNGDRISLYDGTNWATYTFTERSLALGTLTSGKNYDVFIYNNAGTLTLELSAAWTSDTARTDAITLTNGVYVKSSATTRRYLGTFRTTSTTTTEDSLAKRFVWNMNNPVERLLYKNTYPTYAYTGHPYTTASWRNWNNDSAMSVHFVNGLDRNTVVNFSCASSGGYASQGAAFDGGTPGYDSVDMTGRAGRAYTIRSGSCLGYHYCTMLEYGTSGTTYIQAILEGSFWC